MNNEPGANQQPSQPEHGGEGLTAPEVRFLFHIERPASPRVISTTGAREINISGWAGLTSGRSVRLSVALDGQHLLNKEATQPRPDVVQFFVVAGTTMPLYCGFSLSVIVPDIQAVAKSLVITFFDDEKVYHAATITVERFTSLRYDARSLKADVHARSHYKEVWNSVSGDVDSAKMSVAGFTDEAEFAKAAERTLQTLTHTIGVNTDDIFLEIGCGVGRVGRVLSPLCKKWIGCDVSGNMLSHAKNRLADLNNIELAELNGWDLASIPNASADAVYCTVVFMHLDEWDRFNYVCEAFRVLKPGGRVYVDNFNLLSPPGWEFFMKNMLDYHPVERPANISKSSTPSELHMYLKQAGFKNIRLRHRPDNEWVAAWGKKPGRKHPAVFSRFTRTYFRMVSAFAHGWSRRNHSLSRGSEVD